MISFIVNAALSTRDRYALALEHRDFRNMWLANFSAQAAAWGLIVARAWFVYDDMQSSSGVGLTTFAAMAPAFIVPAIAGVLADRFDRRKLLGYTYLMNLGVNLVLAAMAFMGGLELWHVVALSLLNGTARYAQMPISQALSANLVPRDVLLNALSLTSATTHIAKLVGPAIVTPVLVLLGPAPAFLLCTLGYALGWFQVQKIASQIPKGAAVAKGANPVADFVAGIRYMGSQPLIAMVTIIVCFHCSMTMAYESALPGFSQQNLGDHSLFGVLMTAVGIGSAIGSIYIGGIRSALVRGRLLLVMGILSGAGQMLLAFSPNLPVAWVAAFIMGWNQAAFMTLGQAITQSLADDEYRGRIASINTMSFQGLMALMNLSNGMFADQFGAAFVLLMNGVLFVLVMLLSFLVTVPRRVSKFWATGPGS
ncbi:MAG: MFS transporter, partial [Chloroflexota bacterium]